MSNTEDEPGAGRPVTGADLVIPVAGIALAIYYFSTIIESPWTAQVTAFFVGIILIALSLLYIARSIWAVVSYGGRVSFASLVEPRGMIGQRSVLFALTLGSLLVIPYAGFTLTSILFLSGGMLLLNQRRKPLRIVLLAILLSVIWFILFVLIFQRRFPLGWLDHQISAIFKPLLAAMGLG